MATGPGRSRSPRTTSRRARSTPGPASARGAGRTSHGGASGHLRSFDGLADPCNVHAVTRPRLSLDTIRARVRRFQLTVGLGFGAAVGGLVLVSPATGALGRHGLSPLGAIVAFTLLA